MHTPTLPILLLACTAVALHAGPFDGAAETTGSFAVSRSDSTIEAWASGVASLNRGPQQITSAGSPPASFGIPENSLGPAQGTSFDVISLGDGGTITLTFGGTFSDGPGWDLAVFENSFGDTFLELAFVEVSSNGSDFFRFPAISLTQTTTQLGAFDEIDPTDLFNLAGKYRQGFGTPFDLSSLAGVDIRLDVSQISHVRIVDVIGSIDALIGSTDSEGRLVNDPFPTGFASSGFDLDAVAVRSFTAVPEPSSAAALAGIAALLAAGRRRR